MGYRCGPDVEKVLVSSGTSNSDGRLVLFFSFQKDVSKYSLSKRSYSNKIAPPFQKYLCCLGCLSI